MAAHPKDWTTRQGITNVFLDQDSETGLVAGEEWDAQRLNALRSSQTAFMIVTQNIQKSAWCFAGHALARSLDKKILAVFHSPVGAYLTAPTILHLNLTPDRDGGLAMLARRPPEAVTDPRNGFDLRRHRSPFPGLRPFESSDAALCFGRDDDVARLLNDMRRIRGDDGATLGTVVFPIDQFEEAFSLADEAERAAFAAFLKALAAGAEDALALIASAMAELFVRHGGGEKTDINAYRALGDGEANPLPSMVQRRAEAVYDAAALTEADRRALETTFKPHLSGVDERGAFVRRPALRSRPPAAAPPAWEKTIAARLRVASTDAQTGERRVEVVHAARLREWPRAHVCWRRGALFWFGGGISAGFSSAKTLRAARRVLAGAVGVALSADLANAKEPLAKADGSATDEERAFVRSSEWRDFEWRRIGPVFAFSSIHLAFVVIHNFFAPWRNWPFSSL